MSEEEERPSLNVVTRAQSLRDKNTQKNLGRTMTKRLLRDDVDKEGPKREKIRRESQKIPVRVRENQTRVQMRQMNQGKTRRQCK